MKGIFIEIMDHWWDRLRRQPVAALTPPTSHLRYPRFSVLGPVPHLLTRALQLRTRSFKKAVGVAVPYMPQVLATEQHCSGAPQALQVYHMQMLMPGHWERLARANVHHLEIPERNSPHDPISERTPDILHPILKNVIGKVHTSSELLVPGSL